MDNNFTEYAAKFAAELNFDMLPTEVVKALKNSFLDLIGVAVAGSRSEEGHLMLNYIKSFRETGTYTLLGAAQKADFDAAVLANGLFSHALDFDDCNDSIHGHPSVPILPAILSLSEKYVITGRKAIEAYAAGFEVEAAIGRATGDSSYEKGFHATSVIGVFGATVATGKILDLTEKQICTALGIAASMASGLKQNFGTTTKPLHAGLACLNGIRAAQLAKVGFSACQNIFEARQGYPVAYCKEGDFNFGDLGKTLGMHWDIIETGIILKKWACCAETHRGIDAALKIKKNNLFVTDDVVSVECLVQERIPNVCIYHRPKNGLEAKFSQEYCVARALMHGELKLCHFEDSAVVEEDLQSFIKKVEMRVDPEQQGRGNINDEHTVVVVTLKDGRILRESVQVPPGSKHRPLTAEERYKKYIDCVNDIIGKNAAEEAKRAIDKLEFCDDISSIVRYLSIKE